MTWLRPPGPVASGLRIGLLGGSFNPAHEGHLYVGEVALRREGFWASSGAKDQRVCGQCGEDLGIVA